MTVDAETQYQFTADQVMALFATADEAAVLVDDAGTIVDAGGAFTRLTGVEAAAVIGTAARELPLANAAAHELRVEALEPWASRILLLREQKSRADTAMELTKRISDEERITRLALTFARVEQESFQDGVRTALIELAQLDDVDRVLLVQLPKHGDGASHELTCWETNHHDVRMASDTDGTSTAAFEALADLVRLPNDRHEHWIADLLDDAGDHPASGTSFFAGRGTRTLLAVELGTAAPLGLLVVESDAPNALDASHATVVRAAADLLTEAFERHESERELHRLATVDLLTGLDNRWAGMDSVRAAVTDLARGDITGFALLLCDIDSFKDVNDSLGRDAGDELLRQLAGRLSSAIEPPDVLFRLGGDELLAVLRDVSEADAVAAADRLRRTIEAPFMLGETEVLASMSVGILHVPRATNIDASEIVRCADAAMYRAKADGRNRVVVFHDDLFMVPREHLRVESALRTALNAGDLRLEFEDEIQLATGEVVALEATPSLIDVDRRRPAFAMLGELDATSPNPGDLLERSPLAVEIAAWCLREATRQAQTWVQTPRAVRVRVPQHLFHAESFVAEVRDVLARSGVAPDRLLLSVSETAFMNDADRSVAVATDLRRLGVSVTVDEFGSGPCSIVALRSAPVSMIRINHRDLTSASSDRLLSASARLAREICDQLVATAVTTGVDRGELATLGFTRLQDQAAASAH